MRGLYTWLWRHTTGEPWTYIMRRHPWPFAPILGLAALVGLFAALLAGHVYWGQQTKRRP